MLDQGVARPALPVNSVVVGTRPLVKVPLDAEYPVDVVVLTPGRMLRRDVRLIDGVLLDEAMESA